MKRTEIGKLSDDREVRNLALRFVDDGRHWQTVVADASLNGSGKLSVRFGETPGQLESGAEGSVHIDSVLEYNEDPGYMADLALYRLSQEARERFEASGLSAREVARSLGTSPAPDSVNLLQRR